MFKINRNNLLKKYINLYLEELNPQDDKDKIQSFNDLIKKIEEWYKKILKKESSSEYDQEKIFCEKTVLKAKINNCNKNEIVAEVNFTFSIIIPLLILFIDKACNLQPEMMIYIIIFAITAYGIYSCSVVFYSVYKNSEISRYKSFNILCLDILEKLEKEINLK